MSEKISEREQKSIKNRIIEAEEAKDETAATEVVGPEAAEAVKAVVVEAIKSEFSGPIPPPSIIKDYEEILPGAADRIISMAERQATHRQEMERRMIEAEARDSFLGILFAFFLGGGCIIAAIIMVSLVPQNGGAIAGALLGVTGVGSITSSFIRSVRGGQRKDIKEKQDNSKEE